MAEVANTMSSTEPTAATDSKVDPSTIKQGNVVADAPDELSHDEETAEDSPKPNGHLGHTDKTGHSHDHPTAKEEDTAMKEPEDATETTAAETSVANPGTNGTPATAKKASNGSSKKKSSAIPEHKSKKLNKKKSRPMTHLDAKPGELYLARMKGHQPWPSVICDEEMLPQVLLSNRPVTTKQPDGTYKKPEYADGGKRAYERTFPLMFLYTNEFAWIPNTELTPLDPESCKDTTDKGKSKGLIEAYKIAAEGHDLSHFKEMLADHMRAMEEDAEARAEREAKKASKAKRKSMDASAASAEVDDADEMDMDAEGADNKPKSKKRKKSMDSDGLDEKPAKTPKTATKLKLSTPKTPAAESSTKKKTTKTKAPPKKSAAKTTGSEDDMIDTPRVEEKPLTPAEAKQKKEKEVLYYRHKLQRGFLSRDTVPKEEEMKSMSDFLGKLETYPDLEGSIIRATKIHKVLKAMIKLQSIPKDEEYQFKKRSHELLTKWNKILQDDPNAGAAGDKDDDAKPESAVTNGVSKDTDQQAEKAEAGEDAAPAEASEEALENKIGTTTEGEKEDVEDEAEKPAQDSKPAETDEPNIDSAPSETYQPPAATVESTA